MYSTTDEELKNIIRPQADHKETFFVVLQQIELLFHVSFVITNLISAC